VFFVVCDGLKGLPEVVGNVWPLAIVRLWDKAWEEFIPFLAFRACRRIGLAHSGFIVCGIGRDPVAGSGWDRSVDFHEVKSACT
jgi:hypothetical protein